MRTPASLFLFCTDPHPHSFFCFVVCNFICDLLDRDDHLKLKYQDIRDVTIFTSVYDLCLLQITKIYIYICCHVNQWLDWNSAICNQSRFPCRIITENFYLHHLLWILTLKNGVHNKYRIVLISCECCLIARLCYVKSFNTDYGEVRCKWVIAKMENN